MSGPETGLPTGSGSAAILAAGIGTFVLSILAIAADKVVSIKRLMMFHKPTGPLSGVTTSAILVWLVAWAILNARWRGRSVAMARVNTAAFILLGLSLLLTFPLVADLSRYARAVASSSRPMISVHYNQGSLTGEQRCPRKCRRMAGIRNCISVWFAYTFCTMPRRNRSSASGSSGSWAATDTASVQERYTHFFTAWSGADGCARACNWSKADGVKLMPRQARAVAR